MGQVIICRLSSRLENPSEIIHAKEKHRENKAEVIIVIEIKVKMKFIILFTEMYLMIEDKTFLVKAANKA